MKYLTYIYVLIFLLVSGAGSTHAQSSGFFETLYDIPMMKGMEELPEMAMSFDKPNGRIAEVGAIAPNVSEAVIIDFYNTALFQMGWLPEGARKGRYEYTREDETLAIFFDKSNASLVVRFVLEPAPQLGQ